MCQSSSANDVCDGKEMPAGLVFMVQAIFGIMGSQSIMHLGALSVRLSEGSPALMTVCTFHNFSHNREVSIDSHNHSVGKFDCGLLHPLLHSFVPTYYDST